MLSMAVHVDQLRITDNQTALHDAEADDGAQVTHSSTTDLSVLSHTNCYAGHHGFLDRAAIQWPCVACSQVACWPDLLESVT